VKTRNEFLADVKARALEIARAGDLIHAVSIMSIETAKREDLKAHPALMLLGTLHAMNDDRAGVIGWIESFS
jgi:hypothetical protein